MAVADDPFLITGVVALGLALAGIVGASVASVPTARSALAQRRAARAEAEAYLAAWSEAETTNVIRDDLMVLEMEIEQEARPKNYRHNVHCPTCGRFARRLDPASPTIVVCAVHEVQVRWKDIPVDWANSVAFVEGQSVQIMPIHLAEPVELTTVMVSDLSGPIPIIVPDDLSMLELEEAGAVL